MSDGVEGTKAWNRARALKFHEQFRMVALAVENGAQIKDELRRVSRLIHGSLLTFPGGQMYVQASLKTLEKEFRYWRKGGRDGEECEEHILKPEALLCSYKPGCGGHRAMPRELAKELQRRMTLQTGARDKHGKSPLSAAIDSIKLDFKEQRYLPGVDYELYPVGAEFPWSDRTCQRKKPSRGLRALGNVGASAHKAHSGYVSMNYTKLRKGELYTLDDVRLDIVCMHEATGEAVGAVCYILMEVASRAIVAYVIKPCVPDATSSVRRKTITEEDVAELLAHGLQAPGFGIGLDYPTHLLFERGTTACSEAAKLILEQVTDGQIKVHITGMVGGVRWIGAARDQARGNSCGKGVIESFNRKLHYLLLHLPGQRGSHAENQPQNMGELGKSRYRFDGNRAGRKNGGTVIDEDEALAQLNLATGGKMKLRLNNLYFRELDAAVREAIARHNTSPGHAYRGHGTFDQAEVAPGVWEEASPLSAPAFETAPTVVCQTAPAAPAKKTYILKGVPADGTIGPREIGIFWAAWSKLARVRPDLDRHAVTRRVLGENVPHRKLTRPQWAQLLSAFRSIAHEARTSPEKPF